MNFAEINGKPVSIDLMPNGSQLPVTNENRIRYIYQVAHYKLNRRIHAQCRAFFNGLRYEFHETPIIMLY
jgi:ubiquitin-protein ligase E3 C